MNMNKKIIITILFALAAVAGQGQVKCHVVGTVADGVERIAFGISYGSVCGYHSFSSYLSVAVQLSSFGSTIGNIECRSSDNPSICKP